MLAFAVNGTKLKVHVSYELIRFHGKVIKLLKICRENIDYVSAKHYGFRLRKSYKTAESTVVKPEALSRKLILAIRKFLSGTLDKNLKELIEGIRLSIQNTRNNLLRRLKKTLRKTLLFDLISSIIDVPIKCHDYII